MTRRITIATALALAAALPAVPAQAAGAGRTFVSAAGSDSNNCVNVATPCRHLATAFAATAADGEIYVLDPANYGSLIITHGVSIEGHGWASIAPGANGNAITINANSADKINIVGVVLDGTGNAATNGIVFNSGGSLNVQDSVIRNFTNNAINFLPNSSDPSLIFVSNTLLADSAVGIQIEPNGSGNTTSGVLDHVKMQNNGSFGLSIVATVQTTINVTIGDSVSANNGNGIFALSLSGTPVTVMVRNSTIAYNSTNGLGASASAGGSLIRVTRSTITGNGTAWLNAGSGQVLSYGDNNIDGNGAANSEPPNPLVYQ